MEDIVNGRLDNSGPLREDQQSGLWLITPEHKAAFMEGHQLRDLVPVNPENRWVLDYLLIMMEAVLDFARRRQLPPPSWWITGCDTSTSYSSKGSTAAVSNTKIKPRALGKTPRIREYLIEYYPEGVPDPAHCPRKALQKTLIKRDQSLSPLNLGTLKKAIDAHNANLPKS
jgi:hypothetical protein